MVLYGTGASWKLDGTREGLWFDSIVFRQRKVMQTWRLPLGANEMEPAEGLRFESVAFLQNIFAAPGKSLKRVPIYI
jgi:hypothetical protein